MATGDWTVYDSPSPEALAVELANASVVVADEVQIVKSGNMWYAFVVEA